MNIHKVKDDKLIGNIKVCGESSLIERMGGKPKWSTSIIGRLDDIPSHIEEQMEREKHALAIFEHINRILQQGTQEKKRRSFFGKVFSIRKDTDGGGEVTPGRNQARD